MRSWVAAAAGLLLGCGGAAPPRESLPPPPEVKLEAFQPTIRGEIEEVLQAVESKPEDPAANAEAAMLLHAHQQNAAAEVYYDRARILEPGRFDWIYLLACVQLEQGKDEAAAANLRAALELDPAYVPAEVKLAGLLLRTGRPEEAEALYAKVLEADPQNAFAWYGMGRIHASRGETAKAAEAFEKALEIYPQYGQAHYALALAYRKLRRPEEARKHFDLGEKHKLEAPPTGDRILTAVRSKTKSPTEYLRAGVELEKQGRLEESVAVHLKVLEIDPQQVQAHINLMSLYWRLGRRKEALEHYRKALAINENLPDCHYDYGVIMYQMGNRAEAKKAFRRAIEINPFYAKAHLNLGVVLEEEGDIAGAVDQFRKAIENQPGYRLAHFHLGRILANQGKLDAAIRHFEQTLEPEDEQTPGYRYALGIAYARKGDRPEALRWIRAARDGASRYDQWELLASIDRALKTLQGGRP